MKIEAKANYRGRNCKEYEQELELRSLKLYFSDNYSINEVTFTTAALLEIPVAE
jgi:hypothetical protein